MKKPQIISGFFAMYFGLIGISFLVNKLVFPNIFTQSENLSPLLHAIGQTSLVETGGNIFCCSVSISYVVFSLIITQLSGIIILTHLLWLYRKLYNSAKYSVGFWDAFKLTVKVSLITELILVIFFLYAIPVGLTHNNYAQRICTVLLLSVNSFNNAGLTHIQQFLQPDILAQNFILQVGIIFGTTMGNLGIFVIDELLAPKNLRQRLSDPSIDWSLISKISIYGAIFTLVVFSGIFYLIESKDYLEQKNLMESVSASTYEIATARGFGNSLTERFDSPATSFIKLLVSLIGSGPFSTGGGLTLLGLVSFYALFRNKLKNTMEMMVSIKLAKNILLFSLVTYGLFSGFIWLSLSTVQAGPIFYDQWFIFSTNQFRIVPSSYWLIDLLKGFTCIAGRIGLLVAGIITLNQHNN